MPFSNILSQERPIQILKAQMQNAHLAKSYLFSGPEGVGKFLTAKMFAQALNCQELELDSCGRCSSCIKIEKDNHPDVQVIDAEGSEIKIEYIRSLQNRISLRPYEAELKVFIIRNAHNLNIASSNAFLKTLEEPTPQSLIILITEKPALLLKTIISRCRVLKFSSMPRSALREILIKDYSLDKNLAHFLAYFCEGRLGSALKLKESKIWQEKNRVIDEFSLRENGTLDYFSQVDKQALASHLNILAAWFRDIYLLKAGTAHSELINLDRLQDLSKVSGYLSFPELEERLNFISSCSWYLEHNVNVKLLQANLREAMTYGAK